ncbi:MAG: alpha/beta hydrolase [Paracoccaceae bacterium]
MTRLGLLNFGLRNIARPFMARNQTPQKAESDFVHAARLFRKPKGMTFSTKVHQLSGPNRQLPMSCITLGEVDETGVILFFHGGGYVAGSAHTHRGMLAQLSRFAGVPVQSPDYRLAHYAHAPAAFNDGLAAWKILREHKNLAADQIVLGGDSAGGGLALALLAHLLETGEKPAGLIGMSPWTDLTLTGESLKTNEAKDIILPAARMDELCEIVLGDTDPGDPRISPLFANFINPPPVYIQASETEILFDDARRMADVLRAAGGEATLDLWSDAPHVWQIFDGWIPEARDALRKAGAFAKTCLSRQSQGEN